MGKIMMNGIQYGVGGITDAEDISYDNTSSGMSATNVQGALDELKSGLTALPKLTNEITVEIPSVTAGGYYLISYISNIIPQGASLIAVLKVNAGGASSLDAGDLIPNGNDLYYVPATTQTNLTIKFRAMYYI